MLFQHERNNSSSGGNAWVLLMQFTNEYRGVYCLSINFASHSIAENLRTRNGRIFKEKSFVVTAQF